MIKNEIIDLIVDGDVAKAIDVLRVALFDEINILQIIVQWNRLQKDIFNNSVPIDHIIARENHVIKSLLILATNMPEREYLIPDKNVPKNDTSAVFLSYNSKDKVIVKKVKTNLENLGIKVTIDSEDMPSGMDIADFINKSIRETDVTVSIVSTKSLLSAWVGVETMNALVAEKIAGKKLLFVVIDSTFYNRKFVDTAFVTVEERMAELKALMIERLNKDRGIEDLQSERTRNKNLLNDLPEIVANLRARLNVDISGNKFNSGMAKLAKDIQA